VIKSWKHKGLKIFFETGNTSWIQVHHAKKLRKQLLVLNSAQNIKDLNLPGYAFHKLNGDLLEHFAIAVNGGWRLVFKFENGDAILLNYLNYH
jgi:proteic killer suppression protein